MGAAKCVCCCRRGVRAGTSNPWWRSRCSCRHSVPGYGYARRRTSRNCWRVWACRWCPSASRCANWCTGKGRPRPRTHRGSRPSWSPAHFDTVAPAAEGCDALVASGLMPAGQRTIAEMLGIPYVLVTLHPCPLPSPHHSPLPRPGRPFPPGVTDNRVLWDVDAERVQRALRRAAQRATRVAGTAAGRQRPRPRVHRPPVAGRRPDPCAMA